MMDIGREGPDFDFAISYAGSDRAIAERLASILVKGGAIVFLDTMNRAHLIGKRLDLEFEWIFGPGTRYFVPIISREYIERTWPQHEWSIAIREAKTRSGEFILPLRLDDSLLVGLLSTVDYIDLRQHSIVHVAELLIKKLADSPSAPITHWVATFGLLIEDVVKSGTLPTRAPTNYPHLCDWLADDLLSRVRRSSVTNCQIAEDSRTGETFSVRVSFDWNPQQGPLEFVALDWWEILEVLPFDHIYQGTT
jgi:hypothetical protein